MSDRNCGGINSSPYLEYIGREATVKEFLTEQLNNRFVATIYPNIATTDGCSPLGIHWCLTCDAIEEGKLSQDGHIKKGHFLPPVSLPRRMWAGGEVKFVHPLQVDKLVERKSIITDITEKQGRSGSLVLVRVDHEYFCDGRLSIQDRQEIVYREMPRTCDGNAVASVESHINAQEFDLVWNIDISEIKLFRYSAMTFNSHRIHFDRHYAIASEGYSGLIVHGPLQATLMLQIAHKLQKKSPRKFSYRGIHPMIAGEGCVVGIRKTSDDKAECASLNSKKQVCMRGEISW